MRRSDGIIEARYHRGKGAAATLGVALIAAGCIAAAVASIEDHAMDFGLGRRVVVYGLVLGSVAILALPAFARRMWDRAPRIAISPDALLIVHWNDQPIPWTAIERTEYAPAALRHQLTIWLHDLDQHPPRSRLKERMARLNRRLGSGELTVLLSGLDIAPEVLAVEVVARWRRAQGER